MVENKAKEEEGKLEDKLKGRKRPRKEESHKGSEE